MTIFWRWDGTHFGGMAWQNNLGGMAKYFLWGVGKHFRVGWQNLGGQAWQNIFAKTFWEDQKFCHLTKKSFVTRPRIIFGTSPLKFLGHPTPKFFCHPSLHEIPLEFNLCTDWKPHFNTDYLEMFGKLLLCQPTPQIFLATPPPNYFAVTFQKSFTTHASKDFVTHFSKKIAIPPPKNILPPHPSLLLTPSTTTVCPWFSFNIHGDLSAFKKCQKNSSK